MSDYLADGVTVDARSFVQHACDPVRSVAVEACAGSGKTWLLVSRIVRLLLAGAAPGEILAITFTRRAAQEMHARLLRELKHLAQAEHDEVVAALESRGLTPTEAQRSVDDARRLYERVTTAHVPLTMETFHGWFWRLVSRAPLGAGVPFAPTLLEGSERMRADAWLHFLAALLKPAHAEERRAWEQLVDDLGEFNAGQLLREFLHKRAEWWSFVAAEPGTERQRALTAFGPETDDPGRRVRDPGFVETIRRLAALWRTLPAARTVQEAIELAEDWLAHPSESSGADFRAACRVLLTQDLTPLKNLGPDRLGTRFPSAAASERYRTLYQRAIEALEELLAERRRWRARRMNAAGLLCGALLIRTYQALKEREHALDFTDLEWHAARLLADEDHAAYMQARLDARYRHILVDEFQDTNALQWQVLQAWLAAYGPREGEAVGDRPSVFIVGDPKQSIYRFRRAEPRVFRAAIELLQRDFGGCHLRTNVTRRNAPAIVAVLNRTMVANSLYQPQSTVAAIGQTGTFVQLPLAEPGPEDSKSDTALRDVLVTPRVERVDDTHYREGCALANEIRSWRRRLKVAPDGRPARWSDIMVLVRRRTHLSIYERALRDAGIPFVSDRQGGLLATLEADDLVALLQFLTTPDVNLRLAHALRSPLFGCSDDDLIHLASAAGVHWWDRLQKLPEGCSKPLERARALLQRWMGVAGILPVHDLLDRIYFEGDLRRRYAASVPVALRQQVQANLDAFIELALAIDAGRFPSLPRFIDELGMLRQQGGEEAPDEGLTEGDDAVRLLTIHGAKGLEAEIVVIADAHPAPPREVGRILVSWPPAAEAPDHISLVAPGEAGRDPARAVWFADDDAQCEQEDWNLLYVAATRARQVLVVSGSRPRRNSTAPNWYTLLQVADDLAAAPAPMEAAYPEAPATPVRDFLPERIPTGKHRGDESDTDAMRLGRAWHALLENSNPALVQSIAEDNGLDARQRSSATEAAERVRTAFPGFFSIGSVAEIEIVSRDGATLRIDRLVEHEDALWIIDFKWSMAEAERDAYAAQLRRYAEVMQAIRPEKPIRMGIITSSGVLTEIQ